MSYYTPLIAKDGVEAIALKTKAKNVRFKAKTSQVFLEAPLGLYHWDWLIDWLIGDLRHVNTR